MLKENTHRETLTQLGIKIAFLMHLSAFALVNAGLILVNFQGWTESTILYLLPAWSIGLTLHGITVLLHSAKKQQKRSIIEKNQ